MGTISDKLMRVINTKEDIRRALISKGYDVPTSIPFKEYAKMISDLPCKVDDFPKLPGDVTRWHFWRPDERDDGGYGRSEDRGCGP